MITDLDIVILPELTGRSTTNIVNNMINMKPLPVK